MAKTIVPTLAEYLRMPWGIKIERQEDDDGVWHEATVEELDGLHASVPAAEDLQAAFYDALECHLGAMIQGGVEIPVPAAYRPVAPPTTWTTARLCGDSAGFMQKPRSLPGE